MGLPLPTPLPLVLSHEDFLGTEATDCQCVQKYYSCYLKAFNYFSSMTLQ